MGEADIGGSQGYEFKGSLCNLFVVHGSGSGRGSQGYFPFKVENDDTVFFLLGDLLGGQSSKLQLSSVELELTLQCKSKLDLVL